MNIRIKAAIKTLQVVVPALLTGLVVSYIPSEILAYLILSAVVLGLAYFYYTSTIHEIETEEKLKQLAKQD